MMAIVNGPSPAFPGLAGLGVWLNQTIGRGTVGIRSADPTADPSIEMDLAEDELDRARLRMAVRWAAEVLGDGAFADVRRSAPVGIDGTPLAELAGARGRGRRRLGGCHGRRLGARIVHLSDRLAGVRWGRRRARSGARYGAVAGGRPVDHARRPAAPTPT